MHRLSEVQRYTVAADQLRLAQAAVLLLDGKASRTPVRKPSRRNAQTGP